MHYGLRFRYFQGYSIKLVSELEFHNSLNIVTRVQMTQ